MVNTAYVTSPVSWEDKGKYTVSNIATNVVTAKKASGTEGYQYNEREITTEVTKVADYQEWTGTIGWPVKDAYFETITDDLVLAYAKPVSN